MTERVERAQVDDLEAWSRVPLDQRWWARLAFMVAVGWGAALLVWQWSVSADAAAMRLACCC